MRIARPGAAAVAGIALAIAVTASFVSGPWITATAPTPALAVACWRLLLAAAALAPLTAGRLPAARALRTRVGLGWTLLAGIALGAHFYLWSASLRYTSIAAATTLVNATPLVLVVLERLWLGRRPVAAQWPGIGLALVGLMVLGGGDWALSSRALVGDLLALGGAAACAIYLVAGRAVRPTLGALPYNLSVFTIAAATLFAAGGLGHVSLWGFGPRVWLLLCGLAAVPTLTGHALANFSLAQIDATTVGLAYLTEPVGASVIGYLWLGQTPGPLVIAGGLITLCGLALYLAAPRLAARRQAARVLDGAAD